MTPALLNAEEVARALRVSPQAVRKWARDGEIEHVGLGRRVLFTGEQLARFVEERTQLGRERRKHGGKAKKR